MNVEELVDNLLTFITAGHETTAVALTWTFYLLSLHPSVEQRVVEEIERVTNGETINAAHVEALAYTRQVVLEAMRLYPPVPVVPRTPVREVTIGGEAIPPGVPVYIPIYAVHRHAALWEDVDRFDPERFRPEAVKGRDRYAYLPFGAGPRICIGMTFAMSEAVAILATLVRSVRLKVRAGHVPEFKMRATLRPAAGMPMTVAPR
jgi:cytochrome P450